MCGLEMLQGGLHLIAALLELKPLKEELLAGRDRFSEGPKGLNTEKRWL